MKNLILLLCFSLCCCQRESTNNNASLNSFNTETVKKEYYGFAVFNTDEPIYEDGIIRRVNKRYTTEIQTFKDSLNDDDKFRELDLAEKNLREAELNDTESEFSFNPEKAQVNIIYRDIFIFDKYKDASLQRQKILNSK